jgi:multicopper oxidase
VAELTRRQLLVSAAGVAGVAALGGCGPRTEPVAATSAAVRDAETARRRAPARTVTAQLTPQPATVDLGGVTVDTWAYGDAVPGPLLRARAGDLLRVDVTNRLPATTSVHWHGVALRNDMDGVPGVTQDPIKAGQVFRYEFIAPDPGTYFFHPHSGVQLDRGLYGVLVVDDPHEPGRYDDEWIVVLDDWVDGTGRTPDDVLAGLAGGAVGTGSGAGHAGHDMGGMSGHDMSPMGGMGAMGEAMTSPLLGGAGDVSYAHYLVNGRVPTAPHVFAGRPGQRIRLRIVNAGADTAFRVALAEHLLTLTHADGFPVEPVTTGALCIGMGERYDVEVTLRDGVFPLVAAPEGKAGIARALVRTGAGRVADPTLRPRELTGPALLGTQLRAAERVRLPAKRVDRTHDLALAGTMRPYRWTINGRTFDDAKPLPVEQSERVRLRFTNHSMMFHPMHVHGHTFEVVDGARKDTVIVLPMSTVSVVLDATNPGQWVTHCHNIYHAERGMMTTLSYRV